MKTEKLTLYRPENLAELEQVPKGSHVELYPNGLAIYVGTKDRIYQFIKREAQLGPIILLSTSKRNIFFDSGQIGIEACTQFKVRGTDEEFSELSKLLEGKLA